MISVELSNIGVAVKSNNFIFTAFFTTNSKSGGTNFKSSFPSLIL